MLPACGDELDAQPEVAPVDSNPVNVGCRLVDEVGRGSRLAATYVNGHILAVNGGLYTSL